MSLEELNDQYLRLRADLACAYGEPVWDSRHIDTLTDAIADTEFALAASSGAARFAAARDCGTAVARLS